MADEGPTNQGAGPTGSPQQPWFNQIGSQIGGALSGIGDLIGNIRGTGSPDTVVYQQPAQQPVQNNTLLYIGGGIVLLLVVFMLFRILK